MEKNPDILIEHNLWGLLSSGNINDKTLCEAFLPALSEKKYTVFISQKTMEISNNWQESSKEILKGLILKLKPIIIVPNEEINKLSEEYKKYGLFSSPQNLYYTEAASCAVNNIPVILSTDYKNLVRLEIKMKIKGINQMFGYQPVEIVTPMELF
ncbi:MAG: hypothetical protein AB1498_04930 [bacterium]